MEYAYPEPQDVGITIPPHLRPDRFRKGFMHALKGGQITEATQLKLSFREGYRAGKLYLRDVRRNRGIIEFPMQGRIKITAR